MKEYPYLSDRKKAKNLSLVVIGASALLALINLFKANSYLQCLACVLAAVAYAFAMHYLEYHNVQGQSIRKYIFAFHMFALHALLYLFEGFAGVPGTLSYQMLHGLVDMFLMAVLLATARLFRKEIRILYIAIAAAVTFFLALYNVNVVLNLLLLAAALLLVYLTYKENQPAMLLGICTAVFALYSLLTKDTPKGHEYLHVLAMILMMIVAYQLYEVVKESEMEKVVVTRKPINLEPSGRYARKEATETQDLPAPAAPKAVKTETAKSSAAKPVRKEATRTVASQKKETAKPAAAKTKTVKTAQTGKKTAQTKKTDESKKTAAKSKTSSKLSFSRSWFIKDYKDLPYEDLLNAPVYAFKGVSEEMANDLRAAFNIKTIGDLADSEFFAWAKEITEEAK